MGVQFEAVLNPLGVETVLHPAHWIVSTLARNAAAMRLHTYRDQARSRHFDLSGGGDRPWSVDLVAIAASGILVLGFGCALVGLWVR